MRFFIAITFIFFLNFAQASDFGQYQFNRTAALQRQLQAQKIYKYRQEQIARYKQNPTRNIRYPNRYNQYPNITRNQVNNLNYSKRYSSQYYQNYATNRYQDTTNANWL